jgi:hypothetical protein
VVGITTTQHRGRGLPCSKSQVPTVHDAPSDTVQRWSDAAGPGCYALDIRTAGGPTRRIRFPTGEWQVMDRRYFSLGSMTKVNSLEACAERGRSANLSSFGDELRRQVRFTARGRTYAAGSSSGGRRTSTFGHVRSNKPATRKIALTR